MTLVKETREVDEPDMCRWFVRCTNETRVEVTHPILGWVPCCRRCAKTVGLNEKPWEEIGEVVER